MFYDNAHWKRKGLQKLQTRLSQNYDFTLTNLIKNCCSVVIKNCTKLLSMISQTESVISGGGRDDPALLLLVRHHDQRVPRAALLEAAGVLHVVLLQKDVHLGLFGQVRTLK